MQGAAKDLAPSHVRDDAAKLEDLTESRLTNIAAVIECLKTHVHEVPAPYVVIIFSGPLRPSDLPAGYRKLIHENSDC